MICMILIVKAQYEEEEEEVAGCKDDKKTDGNDFEPPPTQQFQWDWPFSEEEDCSRFQETPSTKKVVVGSNLRHELESISIRHQELKG